MEHIHTVSEAIQRLLTKLTKQRNTDTEKRIEATKNEIRKLSTVDFNILVKACTKAMQESSAEMKG